jgi:hypothetical protein
MNYRLGKLKILKFEKRIAREIIPCQETAYLAVLQALNFPKCKGNHVAEVRFSAIGLAATAQLK